MGLMAKLLKRFFYISPKGPVDSDSAWKLQNEQMQKNEVYKMIDFSGGGSFVEVYDGGGNSPEEKAKALQEHFRSKVEPKYLYAEDELIDLEKYQAWHSYNAHVAIKFVRANKMTIEDDEQEEGSPEKAISKVSLETVVLPFEQHKVKWKLDKRGAVGETPLHLMFLINSEKHVEMAGALLKICPALALDVYEGSEYYAETSLHLSVIQGNMKACR